MKGDGKVPLSLYYTVKAVRNQSVFAEREEKWLHKKRCIRAPPPMLSLR